MNKVADATSVHEVLESKEFLSECARFVADHQKIFGLTRLSSELLFEANKRSIQPLLDSFLQCELHRAVGRLNIVDRSPSGLEEIHNAVRYQFILNGPKFEPGRERADGQYTTFGYAAFQRAFIRLAWTHVKRGFLPTVSIDADEVHFESDCALSKFAVPSQPTEIYDVKVGLVPALRFALNEATAWDVFCGIVYENKSVEDLQGIAKVSSGWISIVVTATILEKLQAFFGDRDSVACSKRPKITDLRELLCDLLPEHEFRRRVPRPIKSEDIRKTGCLPSGETLRVGALQP
ncbi:MAG: hypothetical protein QOH88_1757 [Verrucomicrobiota bacterium]|jgi:hypothetical protein